MERVQEQLEVAYKISTLAKNKVFCTFFLVVSCSQKSERKTKTKNRMTQFLPFISKQNNSINHRSHGIKLYVAFFNRFFFFLWEWKVLNSNVFWKSEISIKIFYLRKNDFSLDLHLAFSVACIIWYHKLCVL